MHDKPIPVFTIERDLMHLPKIEKISEIQIDCTVEWLEDIEIVSTPQSVEDQQTDPFFMLCYMYLILMFLQYA